MPGFMPGIHALRQRNSKDVDGNGSRACPTCAGINRKSGKPDLRHKAGHDELKETPEIVSCFSSRTLRRNSNVIIGFIVAVLAGLKLWFMHQTPPQVSTQR